MGPAAFIIAIFGCGEGDAPCEPVRRLEPLYASEAACADATEAALTRHGDADYPVVVARCIQAGAAPAPLKAEDVRLPDARPPVRTAGAARRE
jgi:hypothetical protein